jgi:hypothetical protein
MTGLQHDLTRTNAYGLLRQLFYEGAISSVSAEVHTAEGWTTAEADAVGALFPEARHAATAHHDSWLAMVDGVEVLVELHSNGDWEAHARGEGPRAVAAQLARVAAALPGPTYEEESGSALVRFWSLGAYGPESTTRRLAAGAWGDVEPNYPGPVGRQVNDLMAQTAAPAGRLALWHGPPGTGKTHAIRALAEAWQPWCDIDYVVDTDEFFGNGNYMASVLLRTDAYDLGADRWRLIVVEDAGEFVKANATGQGLARLLNLADGLIGQGLQVMVLLTTNEPIDKLHPAMTRRGRCMSNVRFRPFEPAEADAWVKARFRTSRSRPPTR